MRAVVGSRETATGPGSSHFRQFPQYALGKTGNTGNLAMYKINPHNGSAEGITRTTDPPGAVVLVAGGPV